MQQTLKGQARPSYTDHQKLRGGEGHMPSSQQDLWGHHRKPDPSSREVRVPGVYKEGVSLWMLVQRTHGKQLFNHLLRKYQGKLKREWICDFCLFQKDSVGRFMRKPFPNTLNLYGMLISKALLHLLAL